MGDSNKELDTPSTCSTYSIMAFGIYLEQTSQNYILNTLFWLPHLSKLIETTIVLMSVIYTNLWIDPYKNMDILILSLAWYWNFAASSGLL